MTATSKISGLGKSQATEGTTNISKVTSLGHRESPGH